MGFIRKMLWPFRRRRQAPARGYDAEVLFAGWVDIPATFREIISRR